MSVPRSLRTVFIVAIITLIVWVMADRSVLRTSNELSVQISVRADAMYRVTVVEPAAKALLVKFTGPGRGIDGIMAQMSSASRVKWEYYLSAEEAEKAASASPGTYSIPVRDGFARLTGEYRVTLAEASAPQVVVKVQKLLQRNVPVELPADYRTQLTNEYEFDPKDVTAIGTKEDLEALTSGAAAQVSIDTLALIAGRFDEQTVDVKAAVAGSQVTFEPAKVTAKRLRLSEFIVQKKIEGKIPILIEATPEVMKKYYVVLDRSELTSLLVTAPQGLDIKPQDVHAVLKLLPGEEPNPQTPKLRSLMITFPNLDRVRVKVDPDPVSFTLNRREPVPVPPPG